MISLKKHLLIALLSIPFLSFSQDVLSLKEAVQLALQNNYAITIVRNNEEVARNTNSIANAGFLPDVNITADKTYNLQSSAILLSNGEEREASGLRSNSSRVGIMMDWTIFDGFSMFINKSTLEEMQHMSEQQTRAAVENTIAQVVVSYYNIVQQEKMTKVMRESMNLSKKRSEMVENMVRLGAGSQIMRLQANVDLNADSALIIRQKNELKNAKSGLNVLLSRDPQTAFEVDQTVQINTSMDYVTLLQKSKLQNPQLNAERIQIELSQLEVDAYKSQFYPKLNLFAGYNYNKNNFPPGFSFAVFNENIGPTYGAGLTWNIFNGTYATKNLQSAKIKAQNSSLQYKEKELEVTNAIYTAYNDYEVSLELIQLEEANLALAKENLELAFERYRLGVLSDIELREIQLKSLDAESRLLMAQYLAKQAETELLRLSGEIHVSF